jgi:hypothetical protein
LQAFLCSAVRARGIPVREEVSMCSDLKRDADILLPHWSGASGLAIDVGVCHPCPPSSGWDSDAARRTLAARALRKVDKYSERCLAQGARFAPFVVGTWGSLAPGAAEVWSEVQRRLAAHETGSSRSRYITELQQGLSMSIFKGIAAQLQATHLVMDAGRAALSPLVTGQRSSGCRSTPLPRPSPVLGHMGTWPRPGDTSEGMEEDTTVEPVPGGEEAGVMGNTPGEWVEEGEVVEVTRGDGGAGPAGLLPC